MNAELLDKQEQERVIAALSECYRRLEAAELTPQEITQDGFSLMFTSAYNMLDS
ncbi:hypothetical protein KDD30_19170 (plasmid) [Photobacterium sp. GJ3]|uniref:hypothetical protein n=1 Tax=Photobacterium sp. GJ3 TaxID=2829502 RepID=UPI001B8AE6FF|nr:hypothetical protein [Photobacterium sp. GJ3]QUJ70246.1 hypothetical protein KDD30_19170 [Photobacterium sp. GJ3]